ncbi:TetR/AcrR family transcriptional regulator [Sandaracinus amylolyticus]|uniref:TetR/AcrR family transcriptional regulator n=1 Tax=Sandaracinus amylolyticus TaxID=927083 RepID=UPI001F4839A5|nr:TetR/AcrR family transcriptional regulator [Sandaracinus amylolyticus]
MSSVKQGSPRRGRPRSDVARRAILEATRDQLAELGYERLSIQRVAEVAGVGKQTVYRWWPTKRELVAECVLEGYVLPSGYGPDETGDLGADAATWLRELAAHYGRPPQTSLLRALTSAAAESDEVASKLLAKFVEPSRSALVARLTDAQRAGRVQADAPLALVAEALIGALVFRVLSREPVDADAMGKLAEALFAGIEQRPRGATKKTTKARRAR